MTEPTAKVLHVPPIETQPSVEDLKDSRCVTTLRTDPGVALGDAGDLCESDGEDYELIELPCLGKNSGLPVSPTVMVYDLPSCPVLQCKEDSWKASCLSDMLETDCTSVDTETDTMSDIEDYDLIELPCLGRDSRLPVSPTFMVYDLPRRPVRPCWEGSRMASCLSDTLETDCTSIDTDTDTIVEILTVDDSVTMDAPAVSRTECDLVLTSLEEDDGQGGGAPCGAMESSTSVRDVLPGPSDGGLPEACVELQRTLETNMADMRQDVHRHLDRVTRTLATDLQLRDRRREEERWSEHHRQRRRMEGLPPWLRRLGNALTGLVKRRPKSGRVHPDNIPAPSSSSSAEAGNDSSWDKELCHVAHSACNSQEVMEKIRETHALDKARQEAACDERTLGQLLKQLDDVEKSFRKQKELILQEVESTLNRLHIGTGNGNVNCTEDQRSEDHIHPQSLLLPPANWAFGLANNTSEGPVDEKEEKRRRKEILKRKKPKKMGLKRRFFLCLRCLT